MAGKRKSQIISLTSSVLSRKSIGEYIKSFDDCGLLVSISFLNLQIAFLLIFLLLMFLSRFFLLKICMCVKLNGNLPNLKTLFVMLFSSLFSFFKILVSTEIDKFVCEICTFKHELL